MVTPEKYRNALQALNRVLVVARMMGYENAPGGDIAAVLDTAEYLVVLLLKDDDRTEQFRGHLIDLSKKDERFGLAVTWFDDPPWAP